MLRVVLFSAIFIVSTAFAQTWSTLSSPEGKFSVKMPGQARVMSRTDKDGGYSVTTKTWVSSASGGNYIASVSLLPSNAPAEFAKNMMSGIKSGFMKSANANAISDKPQAYNGIPGRLIKFEVPQGAKGALWICAKNGKVYTLTVAKQTGSYDADVAAMFGSFKVK